MCIRDRVRTARVYLLGGALSEGELARIKKYVINPVEAREAALSRRDTLKVEYPAPAPVEVLELSLIHIYIRGGCSPVGMKKRFVTVVDASAENWPTIMVSAGRIGAQVELRPADLLAVTGAAWGELVMQ